MKKKKSPSESIPLNVPPTQSLSAGFSDTVADEKHGGVGQRHADLALERVQSSGRALIAVVDWRKF